MTAKTIARLLLIAMLGSVVAACGGGSGNAGTSASTTVSVSLPLGDGQVSTTPKVGYVMSCVTQFAKTTTHSGPWIQGDVWYPSEKIAVEGSVSWSTAQTSITLSGSTWTITSNNLPNPPQTTGTFPIQASDPAYQYDTNPNSIQTHNKQLTVQYNPTVAASPTWVPLGMIGFTTDGVAIFNALDDSGHDAVAHEVQDSCDAHPDGAGQYHYHGPSPCMPNETTSGLVGYALDGFGIYGEEDPATSKVLHNSDLDACHGTTSQVDWHGQPVTMYHYVLTDEYPYTIGCFKGTPVTADLTSAQKNQINNFP